MPANTGLGIPYPLSTDPPAGHSQMQSLAQKVDDLLNLGFPGTPYAMASGNMAFVFGGGAGPVNIAVTFAAGRFTQIPNVVLGLGSLGTYAGTAAIRISLTGLTTSGFTGQCYLPGGAYTGNISANWVAYQATSAAASG